MFTPLEESAMRSHTARMAVTVSCVLSLTAMEFAGASENHGSTEPVFNEEVIGVSTNGEEIFLPLNNENDNLNAGTAPSFTPIAGEMPSSGVADVADDHSAGTFSIIGSDDRKKAPADSAVVQIQRNGYNHCTGWMISEDTLVTAAHCLFDSDRNEWTPKLTFRPSSWSQWSYEFASQKWISSNYAKTGSADTDWGVVKFSRPLSSSWFGMQPSTSPSALAGEKATIKGFPGEKGRGLIRDYAQLWVGNGYLKAGTASRVCYDIDTTGGQSGSPVYIKNGAAVAIHSHGVGLGSCPSNNESNSGVWITPQMIDTFNDIKERNNNATTNPGSSIGSSRN